MKNSIFSGRISNITYDDGAGFVIAKILLDNGKPVVAKGHFPGQSLAPGTWVCFEGQWSNHPQYGSQISVLKSPVVPDNWDDDRVCAILSVQGVGIFVRTLLLQMAKTNGFSVLSILEGREEIPNNLIDEKDFQHAVERWKSAKAHLYASAFLAEAGVPPAAIDAVWKTFGSDLEDIVSENPWRLVEIDGIGFKEADEVAKKLGVPMDSPLRISGAVLAALAQAPQEGHVYTTLSSIIEKVQTHIPNSTKEDVAASVKQLSTSNALQIDRSTKPGVLAIYEPAVYRLEQNCAQMLWERIGATPARDFRILLSKVGENAQKAFDQDCSFEAVAEAALKDWSLGSKTDLTADQSKAALRVLTEPVSLLTGLPGTGKTTTLRAAVSVLKDAGINFLLIAPTGIAAKRLSSVVNAPASTIHRAFGAKGWSKEDGREATYEGITGESDKKISASSGAAWGFGPGNPHPAEVVVVDETSMVDLNLLNRILSGTCADCRLAFVGDPFQLPSVGAGDVLRDMVESGAFPHSHLSQIFRQEGTSGIVHAAHAVHRGSSPKSDGKDFVVMDSMTEEGAADLVLKLAKGLYDRRTNFQVLSPRHAGSAGVTALNEKIRAELNPPSTGMVEAKMGGSVVREGDRVMVVKNDYDRGVYNGDVGTVRRIDRVAKDVEVNIFGLPGTPSTLVRFPFKDATKSLRLAYTQTIHKCVSPDTLVWVNGGIQRIEDVPVRGWVSTPSGMKYYKNKVVNPEAPAVRITTFHGYQLTGTMDHGIDVWDASQGKYVRKEMSDLSPRDWVRLVPCPTASLPDTAPKEEKKFPHIKGIPFKYPRHMTPELAELIGLVLAFGHSQNFGLQIYPWKKKFWYGGITNPIPIVERFTSLCQSLFKVSVNIDHHKNYDRTSEAIYPYRAQARSKELGKFFKAIDELKGIRFLGEDRVHKFHIPSAILTANEECKRAFLKSFFWSARPTYEDPVTKKYMHFSRLDERVPEGTVPNVSRIWARSINPRIDSELRALLLEFGVIVSRTSTFRSEKWKGFDSETKVILRDEAISIFQLKIGFPTDELVWAASLPKKKFALQVPVTVDEIAQIRSIKSNVHNYHGSLSLALAREVAGTVAPNPIVGLMADRIRFFNDWILKIEHISSPSVCLEVPEGHQFIQNGFSAWNSQGQEYDVIVLPLLSTFGKQLQRNLLYTAITRARKRVFIVGQTSAVAKAVDNNSAEQRNTLLSERLKLLSLGGLEDPSDPVS